MSDFAAALEVMKGLLTPMIAVLTTYIAWQQWQGNRLRLRLDRYDRRLRVYEQVRSILLRIIRDAKPDRDDLLRFRVAVSEADFLFGSEIRVYLDEIHRRGLNLRSWNEQYRDYTQQPPPGYDHSKVVTGMDSELRWFAEQHEPALAMFKKYLDISA